jgi:hypothetical protein
MVLKKIFRFSFKLAIAAAFFMALQMFCHKQTRGFRPYWILSNLPNDPRWEVPPLSQEAQKKIDALLDQPFTFLGAGGWSFAFLGEDKKTVLKFYRHTHFCPAQILKNFSFKKLLLQNDPWPKNTYYFQEFNFQSCSNLYSLVKERTGILYVHINKTQGKHKPVTLYDNIGVRHTIDLDKTEFIVQKKAELVFPHLEKLAKEKKYDEAKHCIDEMFNCLLALCKNGLRDCDRSLKNNFGYTEDGAVTLDLSSFVLDENLKKPGQYRREIINKTAKFAHILRKKCSSELFAHYEQRLCEILGTECSSVDDI